MVNGVYIVGGFNAGTSSEFLTEGSKSWLLNNNMPKTWIRDSCGVRISDREFALIGGAADTGKIFLYNTEIETYLHVGNLKEDRFRHACHLLNGKIVVSGGINQKGMISKSAEVIDIQTWESKMIGDMVVPRSRHQMSVKNFAGKSKLMVIGGEFQHDKCTSTIEVYDEHEEVWSILDDFELQESKAAFSVLSVPSSLICN